MKENNHLWQTKLAARLHDPAEKALVLLRDKAGHEGGTVKALKAILDLDEADQTAVKRADWWAAAADRPQWPNKKIETKDNNTGQPKTVEVPEDWAKVNWTRNPVLIHPVSGVQIDIKEESGSLAETEVGDIKQRSFEHFKKLAEKVQGDARKTLLAYWRFGPELEETDDYGKLGALWEQLPADTRVPDHSIWEHLDLTSAFAGAFAGDENGEVTLLALSIGPVQPFIASARSTSDLWAGSHLLARLAWETMRPLCEKLGPDAILFPRLRGVPQVDLWLREQGLPEELFDKAAWKKGSTDANPLFAAALPNRFVAVVPASKARTLAVDCEQAARDWLQTLGKTVVKRLLKEAGENDSDESFYCHEQMHKQLEDFPEVHWAAIPFSLIKRDGEKAADEQPELSAAMRPFFGEGNNGFLDSDAWRILRKDIQLESGVPFFRPNPGVLYPAVYDLAERVLAAAKTVRTFGQSSQQGYRCSLTGETEWLTTDKEQLSLSSGQRKETIWERISKKRPAWAKKGEHLGALPAVKRLWPTLFAEEVSKACGKSIDRFVVSTHTMALAHQLDQWLEQGALTANGFSDLNTGERVALPQRLMLRHEDQPDALHDASTLLAAMERAQESSSEVEGQRDVKVVEKTLMKGPGEKNRAGFRFETYYGLLMMDGDRMGKILSGDDEHGVTYENSFHPDVRKGFADRAESNQQLKEYGNARRAISPGRHMAISGALNDFALHIVPHIIQKEYLGRLIYAGGDDVLAMLPVADLLPAAARLRDGWSGVKKYGHCVESDSQQKRLQLKNGYAWLQNRLLRMMGKYATASAGMVVAHHQAPMSRILQEVRDAEKAAKEKGGRDAIHLRIIKRSGGALRLTLKWDGLGVLNRLVAFLREESVSRRAVYHSLVWMRDLPEPSGDGEMLRKLLAYQFDRQIEKHKQTIRDSHDPARLAGDLAELTLGQAGDKQPKLEWLANLLSVAEFLARESRSAKQHDYRKPDNREDAA